MSQLARRKYDRTRRQKALEKAAPDLLSACQEILRVVQSEVNDQFFLALGGATAKVHLAIRKATGQDGDA